MFVAGFVLVQLPARSTDVHKGRMSGRTATAERWWTAFQGQTSKHGRGDFALFLLHKEKLCSAGAFDTVYEL